MHLWQKACHLFCWSLLLLCLTASADNGPCNQHRRHTLAGFMVSDKGQLIYFDAEGGVVIYPRDKRTVDVKYCCPSHVHVQFLLDRLLFVFALLYQAYLIKQQTITLMMETPLTVMCPDPEWIHTFFQRGLQTIPSSSNQKVGGTMKSNMLEWHQHL